MVQVDLAATVEQGQLTVVRPCRRKPRAVAPEEVQLLHGGRSVRLGDDIDQLWISRNVLGLAGLCMRVDDPRNRFLGDLIDFRANLLKRAGPGGIHHDHTIVDDEHRSVGSLARQQIELPIFERRRVAVGDPARHELDSEW